MNQNTPLSNPEKNLIAIGAAMGGGCRKCADKLYELAVGMKIPAGEMQKAFQWGLDARAQAAGTMQAKVDDLLGTCCGTIGPGQKTGTPAEKKGHPEGLMPLVRIASFVAANSAPDAAEEIKKARERGATDDQIRACISIGRMVRKNAEEYSDDEIDEDFGAGSAIEAMCCPSSAAGSSGCSCS